MSKAAAVLLEHARAIRASAVRTRRLADETTVPELAQHLRRGAAELGLRALEMEKRAASIARTVARTRRLHAEIRCLFEEAGERVRRLRPRRRSGSG